VIILCDVDGVVADLGAEWVRRYNERWDDSLTQDDITGWGIEKYVKPECGKKIFDILHEPGLYLDVPDIVGAVEGVKALRKAGHRVVFVTSCVDGSIDQKVDWLRRHGLLKQKYVAGKDFIAANDKSLIRGDMLIDDAPHNLENFDGIRVLFDAHHNQGPEGNEYLRVLGWGEVLSFCQVMADADERDRASLANMLSPHPLASHSTRR
jgi:5'(3')-deoxyribonucleotidase